MGKDENLQRILRTGVVAILARMTAAAWPMRARPWSRAESIS